MVAPHWVESYVGLPETDCAGLVERVLQEQFGRAVALPSERGGAFGNSAAIARHRDAYADLTEAPEDGDGVLMRACGRLEHIGLYVVVKGIGHVLHALPCGVCLHRIRDLPAHRMSVEGYYRWR